MMLQSTDAGKLNARSIEYLSLILHLLKQSRKTYFQCRSPWWSGVVFIEKHSKHQRPLYHLTPSQLFSLSGLAQYDCEPFFYFF